MDREKKDTGETTAALTEDLPPHNSEEIAVMKCGHVQVHLKDGLEVVDVVTPQPFFCKMKLKDNVKYNISENHIRKTLSKFPTERIFINLPKPNQKKTIYCGKVVFKDVETGTDCFYKINTDDDVGFSLVACDDEVREEFTLKVQWWRCPRKNHCFVALKNPEDKHKLVGRSLKIDSSGMVKVKESYREENSLVIFKLSPYSTEEQIKKGLAKGLGLKEYSDRFDVFIPREKRFMSRENELETAKINFETQLSNFVELDKFEANVLPYNEKSDTCTAYVKFVDVESCQTAAEGLLASGIRVGSTVAKTAVEFVGSVYIPQHIFGLMKEDIDEYVEMVNDRFSSNTLHVYEQESGNMYVKILAPSLHKMAKMKKDIDEIVKGYVVDLNTEPSTADKLFTNEAEAILKEIEEATDTKISVNHSARKVTVRGIKTTINLALKQIHKFLKDIEKSSKAVLDLKAATTPRGLLRLLMDKYGIDLSPMISSTGLKMIDINLQEHKVHLIGDKEALLKAEEVIKFVEEENESEDSDSIDGPRNSETQDKTLEKDEKQNAKTSASNIEETCITERSEAKVLEVVESPVSEDPETTYLEVDESKAVEIAKSFPLEEEDTRLSECAITHNSVGLDCPVCLGVVHPSDSFCLLNCNHTYCTTCIASWIDFCEKELAFPLTCMVPGCEEKISNHDINKMRQRWIIPKEVVLEAAIRSVVRNNSDKYRFCLTPMCSTVYKVGAKFRCPGCYRQFCTSCHAPLHQGITCKKYARAKAK